MFTKVREFFKRHDTLLGFLGLSAIVVLFFGLLSVGCRSCINSWGQVESEEKAKQQKNLEEHSLEVFSSVYIRNVGNFTVIHDRQRGVTCWVFGNGVTCLPDTEAKK